MGWYVLHVRPRSEKKVAAVCQARKIVHYLPLRKETKRYQRRKVTVWKPLFNGYVFALVTPENRIHLYRTNHLLSFLEPASEAELLRDLDQIRQALQASPELQAHPELRVGSRVRVISGPFMGIEGVLVTDRGKPQVRLNVDMIGQSVALEVDRDGVEPI